MLCFNFSLCSSTNGGGRSLRFSPAPLLRSSLHEWVCCSLSSFCSPFLCQGDCMALLGFVSLKLAQTCTRLPYLAPHGMVTRWRKTGHATGQPLAAACRQGAPAPGLAPTPSGLTGPERTQRPDAHRAASPGLGCLALLPQGLEQVGHLNGSHRRLPALVPHLAARPVQCLWRGAGRQFLLLSSVVGMAGLRCPTPEECARRPAPPAAWLHWTGACIALACGGQARRSRTTTAHFIHPSTEAFDHSAHPCGSPNSPAPCSRWR